MRWLLALGLALVAASCSSGGSSGGTLPLRRVADVRLPGSSSRIDYMTFDPAAHLLVLAHLGDSTVLGFDTETRQLRWTAKDVPSAHGVRAAPEVGRVFASGTSANQLVAIDETSGAVLGRGPTGQFPDGLAFDPANGTVWVSSVDSGTESVLDARTLAPLGEVRVGGDVGNVVYGQVAKRMVVAVGATNDLVVVDPGARHIERRIPLPSCRGAHGVVLDEAQRMAFVACEDNATVLRVDMAAGRVTGHQSTGDTPDVLALDPALGRLYVAAENGVVGVYASGDPALRTVGRAFLADGAHTVAVDPATHLVYFPLPNVEGGPVMRIMRPA